MCDDTNGIAAPAEMAKASLQQEPPHTVRNEEMSVTKPSFAGSLVNVTPCGEIYGGVSGNGISHITVFEVVVIDASGYKVSG